MPKPDPPSTDREFLLQAVELSRTNLEQGGGPFGALVVHAGEIVGRGANRVTVSNDPTAHAEVQAIRDACRRLKRFELSGCSIFSSCEPCPMCLGAIYWARLDRLVYANTRVEAASIDFDDHAIYDQIALPLADQTLPTVHLPLDEARAVFETWRSLEGKVPY